MRATHRAALAILTTLWTCSLQAQAPAAIKLKTAVIQWVADVPQLTYDIRYTGGDSTTMPTALKYLVKDLAESEGWYLNGEDKSKTIASQAKRISLEYIKAKSKGSATRVSKIEFQEGQQSAACVVSFARKPSRDEVLRTGGLLETFARKYLKVAKSVPISVEPVETAKANVWTFDVTIKDAAKAKK